MIDGWGVFSQALWIIGLAVNLAVVSTANYQAQVERVRLRQKLGEAGFQLGINLGMVLFCVGLLLAGRSWWEKVLWGLVGVSFLAQSLWVWRVRFLTSSRAVPREEASQPVPSGETTKPRSGGPRRWLGMVFLVAGLLILLGWLVVTSVQVFQHTLSLRAHLQSLERIARGNISRLGPAEWRAAGGHLSGMRQDLETLDAQLGPLLPLGRFLSWVPTYGGDLATAPDLLDLAVAMVSAGDRTFRALAPALDLLAGEESSTDAGAAMTERLLSILETAQPELQAAQQELAMAQELRSHLDRERLSPRVAGLLDRLDRYGPWFETAVRGARLAPDLLGAEEPRTYLILAQNNEELRPTGGFISGVGELRIREGRLESLPFSDSYAVDNLAVPHDLAPVDFQRTLFGQLWFFRDTNWDPDFRTSARRALEVYARDRGVRADGVIALDLTALQRLVKAVGPLQVEGIAEPVTGQNLLQVLRQEWGSSAEKGEEWREWWLHRKDFMGPIARALMERLTTGRDLQPAALIPALIQILDEKHLLIYMDDPEVAELLRARNWDGALVAPPASDALLVVDTNVGFNKVDVNIERAIHYRVDLTTPENPRAQLVVTYQNQSRRVVEACVQEARYGRTYADMTQRCYWDYVRVYAPAGSQLLSGPPPVLPAGSLLARSGETYPQPPISPTLQASDWEVWTVFFALEPLGQQAWTFVYQLPPDVLDRRSDGLIRYQLRVFKQPGTGAVPLEVEIILPTGSQVVRASPKALPVISTDLKVDRTFELLFRRETSP